jgi:dimethylargininase
MHTTAIVRTPAETFSRGITTGALGKPIFEKMQVQHRAYIQTLQNLGLDVVVLPPLPEFPDAHFVEDTAVVTPQVAVIARPGADSRQGEEKEVAPVLARYRPIRAIEAPGTLDGGDVLATDRHVFIGLSDRTNSDGARQLARILEPHGWACVPVEVGEGLHFKSSVNWLGSDCLLTSKRFENHPAFCDYRCVIVDPEETYACNTLWVNDTLMTPGGFPRTREKLVRLGLPVIELETSEMRKMDGGLTCLSIRM